MSAWNAEEYRGSIREYYASADRPYQLVGVPASPAAKWLLGDRARTFLADVAEHRKLIVVGPGGSGKTTYLDEVAREYATAEHGLPLFLPLRLYSSSLAELASNQLRRFRAETDLMTFMESSREGRSIALLLDGLDELPDSLRHQCTDEIRGLTDKYSDAHYVASSRDQAPSAFADWAVFRISDLSQQEIEEFLMKRGLEAEIPNLFSRPDLLEIAKRPLYLFSIAEGMKRTTNVADYVMRQARSYIAWRGHSKSPIPPTIPPSLIESVLGQLALESVKARAVWFEHHWALNVIRDASAHIPAESVLAAVIATDPVETDQTRLRFRHSRYRAAYAARELKVRLEKHTIQGTELRSILSAPDAREIVTELFLDLTAEDSRRLIAQIPPTCLPIIVSLVPSVIAELLGQTHPSGPSVLISTLERLSEAEQRIPERRRDIVVLALHGFNTRGNWKNDLIPLLGRETDGERFIAHPWDYGTFRLGILNPLARRSKVEEFHRFYNEIRTAYRDTPVEICAVAHSFGTYIIGKSLLRFPEVRFDRLILVGSVLPVRYPWSTISLKCARVLNEVFGSDYALLAAKMIPGLGTSGRNGFSSPPTYVSQVWNRYGDHSDALGPGHMRETWIPFLRSGQIIFPYESADVPQTTVDYGGKAASAGVG